MRGKGLSRDRDLLSLSRADGPVWLVPDSIFTGSGLLCDHAIRIQGGYVTDIVATSSVNDDLATFALQGIVSNGLIDLQVNGGGGVLFNATPTGKGIEAIIAAHRAFGTAQILPTVISDTEAVLERAVEAVLSNWGMRGLAGIHIEGPHISLAKRGTHSPEVLRPLGDHTLGLVHRLRQAHVPTMITVAPEVVPPDQIAQLVQMGAVVSLGHSDATYEQTCAALRAGAGCFTHLFNAMSPMTSRGPGMVAAALTSSARAGFICDGHHVSDATLQVALSVGGAKDRLFLVSDAMPTVGGPDAFDLYGMEVHLQNGRLINSQGGLAGAHVTMSASVTRAHSHLGLSIEDVLRMGITLPASTMGLDRFSELLGTHIADLLVWNAGLETGRWLNANVDDRRDQ